jgi:hypothetical protein
MNEAVAESVETEASVEVQASGVQEQPQEVSSERFDWLPEKFERPEELANSYKELERKFYQRKDELREQIVSELNEEAISAAPISPGDYDIDFTPPEGLEYTIANDDPMLDWFRSKAHNYGLSQQEFNEVINEYAAMDTQRGPDWNVESQALGEYAEQRLERVDSWAHKSLSEEAYAAFANTPASANMVQLFEELMELNGQPQFNMVSPTEFQERLSIDDLRLMQQDERYWKDKDPAFIAKVRAGFDQYSRQK